MITKDSVVIGVPADISKEKFTQVLKDAKSPALSEASACYDAVVNEGVSPVFTLSIYKHESQYATDPNSIVFKFKNNNPGNCRSSTIGSMPLISTDRGIFVKYPDFATGFRDMAHRLVTPDYVYAQEKRVTIAQIIERWAPASDGNSPDVYVQSVVDSMNSWIGNNSMTAVPDSADIGFPVRIHWAADTGPDRELNTVNTFIVHDTEGYFSNDEPYLAAATAPVASCHALIAPDGTLVYMVPLTTTAWTPGNDVVAEKSINIEMSGFQSKPYTDAQYRSVAAFFNWCVAQGCPIPATYVGKSGTAGIIGHQDVPNPDQPGKFGGASGHTDPGPLFDWGKLTKYISEGSKPPLPSPAPQFPTGMSMGGGFKTFYDKLAGYSPNLELLTLGLPLTNEFDCDLKGDGKLNTVQLFERAALIYEPANATPWDIHTATIRQLAAIVDTARNKSLITLPTA